MIYEMRVYRCVPGRLPALLNRFNTITLKIWERHGIKQAGFFTTLIGESNQELTYFLAWESLADREKKWNAFAADPEWLAKRAETAAQAANAPAAKTEKDDPDAEGQDAVGLDPVGAKPGRPSEKGRDCQSSGA